MPASAPRPAAQRPSPTSGGDHDTPWGMQIAVHYSKTDPPRRVDVAEVVARNASLAASISISFS